MADSDNQKDDFRRRLRKELMKELSQFNEMEQAVGELFFQLNGGYQFSVEEVAKMLKRSPEEIRLIIQKILDRLEQRELLHALPRRSNRP